MIPIGKNPAFQFYPRDWLSDTELQQASAATRGIWINLLSHMWFASARGSISGTLDEIRRLAGCSEPEWLVFYEQNCRLKFADVTFCDGIVTVQNRRMVREEKERETTRLRVLRFRKRESNANVTPPSPSTASPSTPSPTPVRREEHKTSSTVIDKSTPWQKNLDGVRQFLVSIEAPDVFFNEAYWLRIDQWLGGSDSGVYYFRELTSYLAWLTSQNGHRKHKDLLRGFRNWLSTKSQWVERYAQRQAISESRQRV